METGGRRKCLRIVGLVTDPVDGGHVVRLAIVIDGDFLPGFDGLEGAVDHGFGFKVLLPVGIGVKGVVVDGTQTKNNGGTFSAFPGIDVEVHNGAFHAFSFFGSEADNGADFDNITWLEGF